jgi:pilus assembly protein FimV
MTTPFTTGAQVNSDRTLDFSLDEEDVHRTVPGGRKPQPDGDTMLDFDLEALDTQAPSGAAADMRKRPEQALDFGEFSIDGQAVEPDGGNAGGSSASDPLARKLELAEEFRQIGDLEGARDLLEEVVAKGSGTLQAKAQGMLDKLA